MEKARSCAPVGTMGKCATKRRDIEIAHAVSPNLQLSISIYFVQPARSFRLSCVDMAHNLSRPRMKLGFLAAQGVRHQSDPSQWVVKRGPLFGILLTRDAGALPIQADL